MEIEVGKIYKHFKGNRYEVIAIAKHSENLSDLVIYKSLSDGKIWARPVEMWNEMVDKERKIYRFTKEQ